MKDCSEIKDMYITPPACALTGLDYALQTNMGNISKSLKDIAQRCLDRKDVDKIKKLVINVNNIQEYVNKIYLKQQNK